MTSPTTSRFRAPEKKRLHLVMRDGAVLEATIVVTDDMPLVTFLASRKGGWMNANDVRDPKIEGTAAHAALQTDLIALASAPDTNMTVVATAGSGVTPRLVEIRLLGGQVLQGRLAIAAQQRLSDFLAQAGRFVGLTDADVVPGGAHLGDVAVNTSAIRAVVERRAEG